MSKETAKTIKPPLPHKLTRADAIAKTREQWRWLAKDPSHTKAMYFDKLDRPYYDRPMFGCYLCQYTRGDNNMQLPKQQCGEACPLKWPGGCCTFEMASKEYGLYDLWVNSSGPLRQAVATLISLLPEKEEY